MVYQLATLSRVFKNFGTKYCSTISAEMYEEIVPKGLEETIISYLKDQEVCGESYSGFPCEVKDAIAEEEVKDILNDLLFKVNKRIACRDRYDNLRAWHHQYALFDLNNCVPNFCIDDEMFKNLAFRESLLISEVDCPTSSKEVEPRAVGGLCLDVQVVEGHLPANREMPTDAELDRQVFQVLQRVKSATEKKPSITNSKIEREIHDKLREYEEFLKQEMRNNVKKFLVHFSSQFDVDGCNAGSFITAWVDRYLHTLEEHRDEFLLQQNGELNQKTIYVAIQNHKHYMRHTSTLDDLEIRKYYPFSVTKNMVLEGASFLLMRYLAITKFVGTFEMSTMYINGDMCRNVYECVGPKPGMVNGKKIEICRIYRYVIEECGIEHSSVTVLTTYGRIVTQEWEGCNYILNMNPLQYVGEEPPPLYDRLMMSKTWMDDMQLMSRYLDCKTKAEREMKTYMDDHPEIKEVIADFVQNVLLLKPDNIMAFTKDYFQNLYPCQTPRMPYCENGRDKRGEEVDLHFQ